MKYFTLFLFLLTSTIAISQSYYFPAGKVTWIEKKTAFTISELPPEYVRNAYIFDRDTLLDGKLYRNVSFWKVDSTGYRLGVGYYDITFKDEKLADAGAVRATEDGKIYYRSYGNFVEKSAVFVGIFAGPYIFPANTEVLLYDFGMEVGDTLANPLLATHQAVVDSIKFIPLGGRTRKLMYIHCLRPPGPYFQPYETWIEGIGSLNGFFTPCVSRFAYTLTFARIDCYEEENFVGVLTEQGTFDSTSTASCQSFLTAVKPVQYNVSELKLYPVPATDWLHVEFPANLKINNTQVINYLGQVIKMPITSYNDGLLQLNTANLSIGNYVLMLYTDQQILTAKFIKQGK